MVMFIEGKGIVPPMKYTIKFSDVEFDEIIRRTRAISSIKGWSLDSALIGWLGEAAFGKLCLSKLGLTHVAKFDIYNDQSDGGIDAALFDINIQIKSKLPHNPCRVQRLNEAKDFIPLRCDYYIFCNSRMEDKSVDILGYISKPDLLELSYARSYYQKYFLQIENCYLVPISRMIALLSGLQGRKNGVN